MSVLEKATQILDIVAEAPEAATMTYIAHRLGQPRSSIHRLLSELVQLGLLFRVGPRTTRPGLDCPAGATRPVGQRHHPDLEGCDGAPP